MASGPEIPRSALQSQIRVAEWGPQSTVVGTPFNQQPNGSSAFWFRAENAFGNISTTIDDVQLRTRVQPGLITAALDGPPLTEVLNRPGIYAVGLRIEQARESQLVGFFHILPRPGELEFAAVPIDLATFELGTSLEFEGWGPGSTKPGQGFNQQRDGSSAFWVRATTDLPPGVFLTFAGIPLLSTRNGPLITGALIPALVERLISRAGTHDLQLADPINQMIYRVGNFAVQD
jgi:hypothetical protein